MPPTLVIGTVGQVPIYKNRRALSRPTVDWMWSKINSNSKSTIFATADVPWQKV